MITHSPLLRKTKSASVTASLCSGKMVVGNAAAYGCVRHVDQQNAHGISLANNFAIQSKQAKKERGRLLGGRPARVPAGFGAGAFLHVRRFQGLTYDLFQQIDVA